ncbi:MAG: CRISPR-associated endonuclease Cas6 [Nitrospirota bacterium]
MENNLTLIYYKHRNKTNNLRIFSSSVRQYFVDNYPHPLFHNHDVTGKSIYRSKGAPFQFKVINNEVFILALNDGVEFANSFQWPKEIRMPLGHNGRYVELELVSIDPKQASFCETSFQSYRNITPYIALKQEKYKIYLTLTEDERRAFIEKGLSNHILTAAKWCGLTVKHKIETKLIQMKIERPVRIKDDLYFIPFDVMFECNTEIPTQDQRLKLRVEVLRD